MILHQTQRGCNLYLGITDHTFGISTLCTTELAAYLILAACDLYAFVTAVR